MSLNLHKAKSINIFTKLSRPKILYQNEKSSRIITYKDSLKKKGAFNYLKGFLTSRETSLIQYNFLNIKNLKSKNILSTIQKKSEYKNSSKIYRTNTSNNKAILESNYKVLARNNSKINQINSMKFKISLKHFFSNNDNFQKYPNNMGSFSPKNRYRLMKIYETLKFINPPCKTKESNLDNTLNKKQNNNKLNLEPNKKKLLKNKGKNKNPKKAELINYKIDKVNSFQLLNIKQKVNKNNFLNSDDKKEIQNNLDNKNYNEIVSENKKEQDNILTNDYENEEKITKIITSDEKNLINSVENLKEENEYNLNEFNKNIDNKEQLDDNNNYYKINIMENCLNKLYFDYSDGNYPNTNIYNYLINDEQNKNMIINKEIINRIVNQNDDKKNIKKKDLKKEQIINKNKLNRILNKNQIIQTDINENKENINTENIKSIKDIALPLKDEIILNKNNLNNNNNDKNDSDNKKNIDKNKINKLSEEKTKNLKDNHFEESKNNINLLSDLGSPEKNQEKVVDLPIKRNNKNSKVIKKPKLNLEQLLDDLQKSENNQYNENINSVKPKKNNFINSRKFKSIEFIGKNSVIMPPNEYTPSNPFIYSF